MANNKSRGGGGRSGRRSIGGALRGDVAILNSGQMGTVLRRVTMRFGNTSEKGLLVRLDNGRQTTLRSSDIRSVHKG